MGKDRLMQVQTFPIFLPNKGPVLNKPEEFLSEQFSPYSRNMQFNNEYCQGRGGLGKFSLTALNGPVLVEANFTNISGVRFLVFGTSTHLYSYDFGNSRFDILNPTYTTGTIEVQAGTPTKLRGSGTTWTTNVKAGDYVKIGAGSIHTGSTWYKVASVDSNVLITLETAAPTTAALTAYVVCKTFSGTDSSYWDWVQYTDDILGEVILLTNGTPGGFVYWTGSGQVVVVTGTPMGWTACKYLNVYAGRVHMSYTVEGSADQRQRNRWSDVANCLSWPDDNLQDFVDEPTAITGVTKFNGYQVIFKEREAYVGRYVGGDAVFQWEISAQAYGARSAGSIVTRNDFIYYYGHDKKFHRFNLLQDDIISESIFPETKEFDPNQDAFIPGYNLARSNEVRWFCPYGKTSKNNYVFVWNYQQNIPQVWEYAQEDACACFGSFFRTSDVYADDAIYGAQYADETSGFADDSQFLDNAETLIYGGYDGYIRLADSGVMDDGEEYTRSLRLKRLNFGLMDRIKRLWKQQWWIEAALAGSVNVRMRLDDKSSYESDTKSISLVPSDSDKQIIKANVTWDRHAQNFQPEISSTSHFSVLGVLNFYYPKRITVRS